MAIKSRLRPAEMATPAAPLVPVFIGGTGRSGTTILKRVMAGDPRIAAIRQELRIIIDPGGALDLFDALTVNWSPYDADAALWRFQRLLRRNHATNIAKKVISRTARSIGIAPPRYMSLGLGNQVGRAYLRRRTEQLVADLSCGRSKGSWFGTPGPVFRPVIVETDARPAGEVAAPIAGFFDDLYRQVRGDGGGEPARSRGSARVSHWVEDTPYNILQAARLLKLFPECRIIHVHRDFRDVLASYRTQHWGRGEVDAIARRIANVMSRWFVVRGQLPVASYLEIGLEAMAADPAAACGRICEFIGLEPTAEIEQSFSRLNPEDLHGGRWRKEIPASEQGAVGERLGAALAAYGYA